MPPEDNSRRDRAHLRVDPFRETGPYTYPKMKQTRNPYRDDPAAHGAALLAQLAAALPAIAPNGSDQLTLKGLKPGVLVTVETAAPATSLQGAGKVPAKFEMARQDVVVMRTVRLDDRSENAVVFVPDAAREALRDRIAAYGSTDLGNRKRPHEPIYEKIETIGAADAGVLFAETVDFIDPALVWWEFWVRGRRADAVVQAAKTVGLDVHADRLSFPDVEVVFVLGTAAQARAFAGRILGAVAEIHRATGTIEPFLDRCPGRVGQSDFVADLAGRTLGPADDAPVVCILDTGVSAAHPLVAPGLKHASAVDMRWGTDDHYRDTGHGTGLASLALFGDLEFVMGDARIVQLDHGIESVKLLHPPGFPAIEVHSYGSLTLSAIATVEIERPGVRRSFCLACSTAVNPAVRPSSWSGAIDQAAAGSVPGERVEGQTASKAPKRLILVAAGNVLADSRAAVAVGARIEDPAQAWNAMTVGGMTAKINVPDGLVAIAEANTVSPFSADTTGMPTDLLPMKPEVMFEAGNMAEDGAGICDWHPNLSLLAAGRDVANEPLAPLWATSAAVGVAGHFLGRLKAALPDLWPETYRALMVQSARWPQPVRSLLVANGAGWKVGKGEAQQILRKIGYGVPDFEAATRSARNALTFLAQAEIQPYATGKDGRTGVFNAVDFYDLPWPHEALLALGDAPVILRVTLSYFVEPNLSGKAATRPDTYRSYGLRFAMKKRNESDDDFRGRLSRLASDGQELAENENGELEELELIMEATVAADEAAEAGKESSSWLLGSKAISAGSLHSDLWRGKASDLAAHDHIAVHPVGGWWKSHIGQKRQNDQCRYALVISIEADELDVDLYSEAQAQVIERDIAILIG
ncbi:MAG: S8 family peptidase [Brevundimonas sp.]|nr:S8 family peptidase [Brevundimonas sp.]